MRNITDNGFKKRGVTKCSKEKKRPFHAARISAPGAPCKLCCESGNDCNNGVIGFTSSCCKDNRQKAKARRVRANKVRDRDSLAQSEGEVSIWDLVRSPRLEVSLGLEEEEVEREESPEREREGEDEEEKSLMGRVKGLFRRSFL